MFFSFLRAPGSRLDAKAVPLLVSQKLKGAWSYSDSGATSQYTFFEDGTFRAHSAITASNVLRFEINASGVYSVDGDQILITPKSAASQAGPVNLVVVRGRYDAANDQLVLKPDGAASFRTYVRENASLSGIEAGKKSTAAESTLPGVLLIAVSAGSLITFAVSLLIIGRYKSAVNKVMKAETPNERITANIAIDEHVNARVFLRNWKQAAPPLMLYAQSRMRRLAIVYSVAGAACASVLTGALLLEARARSGNVALFFLVFSWPIVTCWNQIAGWSFRVRRRNELMYAAGLVAVGVASHLFQPTKGVAQVVTAFLGINAIPKILIAAFSLPAVRSVGPCILSVSTCCILGAWGVAHFAATDVKTGVWLSRWTSRMGLGIYGSAIFPIVISAAVFFAFGWLLLRRVVRNYSLRRASDQSIRLDSIWLVFSLVQAIWICTPSPTSSGRGVWLTALAYPAYWTVRALGLQWLRPNNSDAQSHVSLLYLRRFRLERRSEQLFRSVTLFWRLAGEVFLIGGADLARSTLQPHTLLDFLQGKLRQSLVSLDNLRVQQLRFSKTEQDPDTRFRVTDFLCSDQVWKEAVSVLIRNAQVILADFRGLTQRDEGALFELERMLELVPFERVLILVDSKESEEYLSQAITSFRRKLHPNSPNHEARCKSFEVISRVDSDKQTLPVIKTLFSLAERGGKSQTAVDGVN